MIQLSERVCRAGTHAFNDQQKLEIEAAVADEVVAGEPHAGGADGVDEVGRRPRGGELEREVQPGRLRHQERGARHQRQAALVRRAAPRAHAVQPELLRHLDAASAGRPPRLVSGADSRSSTCRSRSPRTAHASSSNVPFTQSTVSNDIQRTPGSWMIGDVRAR
jgi:hypothetical protein